MDNNENKIGENSSAGAEKVKEIERKTAVEEKRADEKKNAERRTAIAKAKSAKKEKKKLSGAERRDAQREKRLQAKANAVKKKAERKKARLERAAKKAERRDLIRSETAVQRLERKQKEREERRLERAKARERRHELALKRKERALEKKREKMERRQNRRAEKGGRREHAPGFGGWLAAVIALGTASLAMATVITAGAINMTEMNDGMVSGYMSPVYELDGATDHMHLALSKLRVATSPADRAALLTDLVANGEIIESDLARIPIDSLTSTSIADFVGKTISFARTSLVKLADGEEPSESDKKTIAYLYETNARIRAELDRVCTKMTDRDMISLLKGKQDGLLNKAFSSVSEGTRSVPESVSEGPFAEKIYKVNALGLKQYDEITSAEGEALAENYLEGYSIRNVVCTGEATVKGFTCFNYTATDDRGREFFVQLSEKGGKLVLLDSFEDCPACNYDLNACVGIASEFLEKCGFQSMTPVFSSEAGTTADINFCYEQDGVICYADMVKVKVCETRGVVTGAEAFPYWLNHTSRKLSSPALSREKIELAASALSDRTVRLCLTPVNGSERLCYEVAGTYGGETYFVYLDADSGKEVAIFTLVHSDSGKIIA